MRVINTLQDLNLLREAKVLHPEYLDYLERKFRNLKDLLGYEANLETFSLHKHGGFIILEKGDNVRDLSAVGLNSCDNGLLGTVAETAEIIDLKDISLYQVLIIYNNEYACFFLSVPCTFDPETEAWFKEQIGTS